MNTHTLCLTYGLQAAVAATRHQDAAHTQEAVRLERIPPPPLAGCLRYDLQ
jgi:hypothetical protein